MNSTRYNDSPYKTDKIENYLRSLVIAHDYVSVLDTSFRYRYVNNAYKKHFRIKPDEIIGKTHAEIFGTSFFNTKIKPKLEKCLSDKIVRYSNWYTHKNISRFIYVTCYPYKYEEEIIGIIINGRDLTELKNISEKHKIQKAYFENLFQQSPDAIVILDNNDNVLKANYAFTDLFGFTQEECFGKPINSLVVPDHLKNEGLNATMQVADGKNINFETVRKKKSGEMIHVSIIGKPILMENDQIAVYGIYRDITQQVKTQEMIVKELKEKELLLKEIHHRVKNNMQIISSLLNIQVRSIKDEKDREIFSESQNRIKSMALIHERLYKSDDLTHISFTEYSKKLASYLLASYNNLPMHIDFKFDIQEVGIIINQAIPLGLILNEIISNSLKHAFKNTPKPEIGIQLAKENDNFTLIIYDNGPGLPDSFEKCSEHSLGLHLIDTLVSQIRGKLLVESSGGLKYTILWKSS